ncbi:hypothetical protein [Pseudodesulfovibrio tunisiensis]|uniref:hypothetical protein n=1 Tax=Pseudodesulfovibrio tunisiensis TaxID=463192 RepID=UPI001FB56ABF|nr:hypothetical protein [Pseudodesulfovibrio tunisiensis]
MTMNAGIRILSLSLCLLAAGCAVKRIGPPDADNPGRAWSLFRTHYCQPSEARGLSVNASLYYTRVEPTRRTNRTVTTLWGDLDGPMRLDVAAGMGRILAHLRQGPDGLLAYYPDSEIAYVHIDPVLGATRLGMPFPFSLTQLGRVLAGDFSGLVPDAFQRAETVPDGYVFDVTNRKVLRVHLDRQGRPMVLEGRTSGTAGQAETWRLEVNKYEEGDAFPQLPGRLTLMLDTGEKGVLRIRSRELRDASWPKSAMELILPENTQVRRLDGLPEPENGGTARTIEETS